jgi:hypothetical protein
MGFLGDRISVREGKREDRSGARAASQRQQVRMDFLHSSNAAFDPDGRLRSVGHALVCNEGAGGIGFRARKFLHPSRCMARSRSVSLRSGTVGICGDEREKERDTLLAVHTPLTRSSRKKPRNPDADTTRIGRRARRGAVDEQRKSTGVGDRQRKMGLSADVTCARGADGPSTHSILA